MANLAEKGKELKKVTARLQSLYDQLDTKQIEQRELESKIETFKLKLERAEKIINGLSDEKTRWDLTIKKLTHTYDNIVGDVLISSAVIAYLGVFNFDFRQVRHIISNMNNSNIFSSSFKVKTQINFSMITSSMKVLIINQVMKTIKKLVR